MKFARGATHLRWSVVLALARRHTRIWWRTHRLPVAVVLVAFTWIARPDAPTAAAALWAGFFGAMLIAGILGAGIIAQDFDSGAMALHRLHGVKLTELTAAAFAATLGATLLGFVAWAGAVIATVPGAIASTLALPVLACVLGLVAWCALLILGGAVLPGYGNVAAGLAFVLFGSADDFGDIPILSALFSLLRDVLPLPRHAIEIFRKSEAGTGVGGEVTVLLIGSAALLLATLAVLWRRDPASGWRR